MRIIAVVRAADRDTANQAIANATGRQADNKTFTRRLYRNGNPVAYWCSWNLNNRNYTAQQVRNRLTSDGGFTADEVLVRQTPSGDLSTKKLVIFNGDKITADQFLSAYNLDREPED